MGLSTKLFLLVSSSAGGLLTGAFFASLLKEKREFYKDLLSFVNAVSADVTFRQDGIRKVANTYALNCKSRLKNILATYCESPEEKADYKFLCKSEQTEIDNFFSKLGKSDLLTEKAELENTRLYAEEKYKYYKNKCEKHCPMMTKLGLLIGLAAGILML